MRHSSLDSRQLFRPLSFPLLDIKVTFQLDKYNSRVSLTIRYTPQCLFQTHFESFKFYLFLVEWSACVTTNLRSTVPFSIFPTFQSLFSLPQGSLRLIRTIGNLLDWKIAHLGLFWSSTSTSTIFLITCTCRNFWQIINASSRILRFYNFFTTFITQR